MKDPAILFYTSDFLTGTILMTDEQVGKYIRLLCVQHQKGHLSKEDMLKICKTYDKDIFKEFKEDSSGLFYNERLDVEIKRRLNYSQSRRDNRLNKKTETHDKHMINISKRYVKHMETETETENTTEDKNEKRESEVKILDAYDFEILWELYDKKIGNKEKLKKKWDKLSQTEKEDVFIYIPKYKKHNPEKKYRKNLETFLNNKSWNDEIIKNQQQADDKFNEVIRKLKDEPIESTPGRGLDVPYDLSKYDRP